MTFARRVRTTLWAALFASTPTVFAQSLQDATYALTIGDVAFPLPPIQEQRTGVLSPNSSTALSSERLDGVHTRDLLARADNFGVVPAVEVFGNVEGVRANFPMPFFTSASMAYQIMVRPLDMGRTDLLNQAVVLDMNGLLLATASGIGQSFASLSAFQQTWSLNRCLSCTDPSALSVSQTVEIMPMAPSLKYPPAVQSILLYQTWIPARCSLVLFAHSLTPS